MQSSAKDVDTHIQQAPEERREALTKLRDLCRQVLKGFDESTMYEMLGHARGGETELHLAVHPPPGCPGFASGAPG